MALAKQNPLERKKVLVVVCGPTAAGKTAVAIRLALHFGAEIISADSRQFFRELNIGTAKPAAHELRLVHHHFIDSHSIEDDYDAASFGRDALELINRLFMNLDVVVMCGGSGLYIKAVTDGFDDIPDVDPGIRAELVGEYERRGISWLQEKMQELDPKHLEEMDQQNPHRLIRALEVRIGTGKSISTFQRRKKAVHPFEIVKIGVDLPREELYTRIDGRMEKMIAAGLFAEAESVYSYKGKNALQTVGYQEIFDFLDGKYDYAEAVRLLKQNTRRYAKRQLTWFRREPDVNWFHPDNVEGMVALVEEGQRKQADTK
jgi:tRNA dimethylallyltransferase